MTWTSERVELLKRFWAEGESASHIAELLGGFEHCDDGGRNAVIGKVHRLKLAVRETALVRRRRTEDKGREIDGRPRRPSVSSPATGRRPDVADPSSVGGSPSSEPPVSLDMPITELRPGQCKWPHGDGPFLFCGHAAETGAVYCAFHKRIAYRPAERQAKPFVILGFRKVAA